MGQHKDITVVKGIHIVHAFEFADATARNAAVVVTADIGKVARQLDDDTFYVLQNMFLHQEVDIAKGFGPDTVN